MEKFGCDFGGKASWNMKGVAADKAAYTTAIKEMKDWAMASPSGKGDVKDIPIHSTQIPASGGLRFVSSPR